MSFPLGLDEHDERALVSELERRRASRAAGLCDYCNRSPSTPPCKFPARHEFVEPPPRAVTPFPPDAIKKVKALRLATNCGLHEGLSALRDSNWDLEVAKLLITS